MVRLYTDPLLLDHHPPAGHPEQPERLATVLRHLDRIGLRSRCTEGDCRLATDEELLRVHSPAHLQAMIRLAAQGGGQAEADTWLTSGSEAAARLAAGSAVTAVDAVITSNDSQAVCLVRPPGHHALADQPMGFCIYGSVGVAAAAALHVHELNRILIIDWDVHHGNGTQDLFYDQERVGFFSIHRYPFYPGTGAAAEVGAGPGLGSNCNVPIAYGTKPSDFHAAFETRLAKFADRVKPELILLSAGFDAHAADPVGDLGLDVEDFERMTQFVSELAATHCQQRLVSVLEGGYNPSILAGCVAAHIEQLVQRNRTENDPGGI